MIDAPLISVVLATYNGAHYLAAQLDSIYNQTYRHIEVMVCDDRSTDATVEILKEYEERYGLRYIINETKQGVVRNFEKAVAFAKGDYIALSDQDDVWLPEKLEHSLALIQETEGAVTTKQPAVIFTDLIVVDDKLNLIDASYWHFMKLNPENIQLNRILVENVMTGCTLLMNRATVNLATPMPPEALMHDVWFLLVATCFGSVACLSEQTVLYRQHSHNVVGARQKSLLQKMYSGYVKIKENRFSLLKPEIEQAKSFYEQYQQELLLTPHHKETLETFISLEDTNFFRKKYLIIKHAFYGSTLKKAINVFIRT